MELRVFWRTLRRRWYLSVVVLALVVGGTGFVVTQVGPTYEAGGSALVFPPASSSRAEGGDVKTLGNPYLELAGVNQARDVVLRTLKSRTVQNEFAEDFPGVEYDATPDYTNSAPIILFTVEGGTSAGSVEALDALMARVPQILADLQGGLGLPQDGLVTARKLTQDAKPAVVRKSQVRAGLLATAVLGGIGLLLIALLDSLLVERSRRRAERAAARSAEEAEREAERETARDAEVAAEAEREAARAAEATSAESADDEEAREGTGQPVYTYRIPVESDLAVSPARSKWLRSSRPPGAARDGHRFHEAPPTKPRTRASGRNR